MILTREKYCWQYSDLWLKLLQKKEGVVLNRGAARQKRLRNPELRVLKRVLCKNKVVQIESQRYFEVKMYSRKWRQLETGKFPYFWQIYEMKEISSSFETTTTTTTTIYCGQRVSSVVDLKFCLRDKETRFTNRGRNNKVEFDRVENEYLKF